MRHGRICCELRSWRGFERIFYDVFEAMYVFPGGTKKRIAILNEITSYLTNYGQMIGLRLSLVGGKKQNIE